jgi:uncharacterized protein with HEPN domain
MREPVRDRERLEHIKDAIERIQENINAMSLDNLSSNVLVFYGIVKNIEIIGEAAYNLTNAFRNSHKETPWKSVMSMRNILVPLAPVQFTEFLLEVKRRTTSMAWGAMA